MGFGLTEKVGTNTPPSNVDDDPYLTGKCTRTVSRWSVVALAVSVAGAAMIVIGALALSGIAPIGVGAAWAIIGVGIPVLALSLLSIPLMMAVSFVGCLGANAINLTDEYINH